MDQSSAFPFLPNSLAEQERLRYAIQAAQVGTWHLDIGQQQVWWDQRCQELFGYSGNTAIAYQQLLALVHEQDQQRVDEALRATFDPTTAGYYDVIFRIGNAPDGSIRWLHCQGRAYVDVMGAAFRLSGVARDITAQVQTQEQLEASKARFRNLVLNSPTPTVLFVGRELVIDTVNAPMLQIWKKDASVTGQPLPEVVPELASPSLLEQLQRVYDASNARYTTTEQEQLVIDRLWEQSYFNFAFNPVYGQDGAVFGFIHTATNVTGEVLALQQLQRSEIRFRSLIEEAPVATCLLVGPDLRIEVANSAILELCGKDKSVLNQPLVQVLPNLDGHFLLSRLEGILASGADYSTRGAPVDFGVAGQSETYYVDWTAKPLLNDQNRVYAILVMATDVTQQVVAQQAMQRREAQKTWLLKLTDQLRELTDPGVMYDQVASQLGAYLGAGQVGYGQMGEDDSYWIVRPTYTRDGFEDWQLPHRFAEYTFLLTGFERQQTIVRSDIAQDTTLTPDQKAAYQVRHVGASVTLPLRIKGEPITILFVHFPNPHAWTADEVMLLEEVSTRLIIALERAAIEASLRESEQRYRLLAEQLEYRVDKRTDELVLANQDLQRSNDNLQQFAYVASHDLQEPLRKIQSFSTLLRAEYANQLAGNGLELLERMQKAGERMSTLIRDLLTYSRISTRQQSFDLVSLSDILTGVLITFDWQIEQTGAQIQFDELPMVKGDTIQLSQLFQNLIGNALKFVAPGQSPLVQIRYSQCSLNALPAQVKPGIEVATYHQISVADQGVGFDVKYLERIFQVFQRLHGRNEFSGTGVGLAICQRVVENHGGAITATSILGQGTTFWVYLPA
ncbi:hypothetical protein GCM10027592_48010 [Spirosoma flavus]